jgi:hypothetical protein
MFIGYNLAFRVCELFPHNESDDKKDVSLRRGPSWIQREPENWSYAPGDSILSNRKARGVYAESAAPRMDPFISSSEELGYNFQKEWF